MQLQFKYCGKEINKEDFNKLNDVFKWVTNTTVNSVDFNSVFDGKYKSMREINDHIKSLGLLPLEQSKSDYKKVLEKTLEEDLRKQFTKQVDIVVNLNDEYINNYLQTHKDKSRVFNDGLFSRINSAEKNKKEDLNFTTLENQTLTDKEQNHLSTRHKSQSGETHNKNNSKTLLNILSDATNTGVYTDSFKQQMQQIFAKETKTEEKDSVINKEETTLVNAHFIRYVFDNPILEVKQFNNLQEAEDWFNHSIYEEAKYIKYGTLDIIKSVTKDKIQEIQPIGVKHNRHKLPMSKLFIQFPDALQAIVLASCYGHHCYPTDTDWLNFRRVEGGSENYKDASIRHLLGGEKDKESNLPEIFHQAWNKLAELQLWLEENNVNIKEFSNNYLKNLQDKK